MILKKKQDRLFYIRFRNKIVKCRFIEMAANVQYMKRNGIYYINANLKDNLLKQVKPMHNK